MHRVEDLLVWQICCSRNSLLTRNWEVGYLIRDWSENIAMRPGINGEDMLGATKDFNEIDDYLLFGMMFLHFRNTLSKFVRKTIPLPVI